MDQLEISLLGSFQVTLNGTPIVHFRTDKARALLAYLVLCAQTPVRREMLAGLLWPDQPDTTALRNLRIALDRLRAAIGDKHADPPFLTITRKSIQFDRQGSCWLDVDAFSGLLEACEQHEHRRLGACRPCVQRMQEAADLYRGELLAGFTLPSAPFEEWLVARREQLNRQALETFDRLATCLTRRRAYGQAERYALRQLELEPWREEAHRQCMRALALDGRRNAALAQYETCRRVLESELEVEPAAETTALYDSIRRDGDLGSLDQTPRSNLPVPLTPLIGRERELAEIDERLQSPACRLLTLVGPGGIGKTRLALEAASEQVCGFEHGVFYASLAPVRSAEELAPAVTHALDIVPQGRESPRQQLLRYLRQKETLIVLDNYEHLLSPSVPSECSDGVDLVLDILRAAPDVRVLITSRIRLNVPGEQLYHVGGMDCPPPSAPASDTTSGEETNTVQYGARYSARYSAVQLFLHSARRVREGYEPSDEDLAHVARICRMAQGMPLAILLAAAWMEVLTPAEIAARVERGLGFLEVDWRGVEARHRSMLAVFDVSWRMLDEAERAAFKRLSIFRGGFSAQAAEAVAGASARTLRGLAHKSFLGRDETGRYEIHELLRQYAEHKLDETPGDRREALDRHCAYYTQFLAQNREAFRRRGPRDFEAERANIRTAWDWALQHDRVPEIRRCVEGFFWFTLSAANWHGDKSTRLAPAVALLRRADATLENRSALGLALCYHALALALSGFREQASLPAQEGLCLLRKAASGRELAVGHVLAALSIEATEEERAKQLLKRGLPIALAAEALHETAWTLTSLAKIALRRQEYDQAEQHLLSALEVIGNTDHYRSQVITLGDLARLAYRRGQHARAKALFEQALAILRHIGQRVWVAHYLHSLGEIALAAGDLKQARMRYRESLASAEELADQRNIARSLCCLGDVALAEKDLPAARQHYRRALEIALQDTRPTTGQDALLSLARWVTHKGEPERAVELAALSLRERPTFEPAQLGAHTFLEELRSGLSPEVYAGAEKRGRARDLEATLRELLAEL